MTDRKAQHLAMRAKVPGVLATIPPSMKDIPNWVIYRFTDVDGGVEARPFIPATGCAASADDKATWDTYENAVKSFEKYRMVSGIAFTRLAGAGFRFIGIDDVEVEEEEGPKKTAGKGNPLAGKKALRTADALDVSFDAKLVGDKPKAAPKAANTTGTKRLETPAWDIMDWTNTFQGRPDPKPEAATETVEEAKEPVEEVAKEAVEAPVEETVAEPVKTTVEALFEEPVETTTKKRGNPLAGKKRRNGVTGNVVSTENGVETVHKVMPYKRSLVTPRTAEAAPVEKTYEILKADSSEALAELVNEYQANGWTVAGGLTVFKDELMQAVERKKPVKRRTRKPAKPVEAAKAEPAKPDVKEEQEETAIDHLFEEPAATDEKPAIVVTAIPDGFKASFNFIGDEVECMTEEGAINGLYCTTRMDTKWVEKYTEKFSAIDVSGFSGSVQEMHERRLKRCIDLRVDTIPF